MFRKLLIALILCVVPIEIACARQPDEVSYHGETTRPEGKTSERIESIIDTVNSDAPERVRRFIEEECTEGFRNFAPMEQHQAAFLGVPCQTGGVGAIVRLRYDDGTFGPARLVTAGSGYWSQSSRVQVMGRDPARKTMGIVVYWSGKEMTEVTIPDDPSVLVVADETHP